MADEKISQLPDSGAPQDTDQLVLARSGSTLSLLFSSLKAAIPGGVTSVFTRTGAVTAQTGDYTAAQVGALPSTETLDQIATANATAANVSLNSHKITNLTNGSAASDAAAFGQIPSVPVSSVFSRTGAVVAVDGDYSGVVATHLTGATAATRYVGATASGSPGSGTFAVGDFVVAQNGHVFVCTVAGSPGTWVDVGSSGGVVSSVFSRTGAVVATSGDYNLNQIGAATGDYSINSHKLTSVTDPTSAQDAATKAYVDSATPGNAGGKGHITTATAANTAADLSPGSNGTVLTADSTQSVGLAWAPSGAPGGTWTTVTKPGDTSRSSTTVLAADPDLVFTPVSGGVYELRLSLVYASPGATAPDFKVGMGEDATTRGAWCLTNYFTVSDVLTPITTPPVGIANTLSGSVGAIATNRLISITGWLVGNGGTFSVVWSQNTSSASATILRGGSYLAYIRLL